MAQHLGATAEKYTGTPPETMGGKPGRTRQPVGEAENKLAQTGQEIKEQGRQKAQDIRHKAESFAGEQKEMVSGKLSTLGNALHRLADQLGQEHNEQMAGYAHRAAGGVERLSQTLRQRRPAELVRELEDFARRNPGIFLGAALAGGVMLGRFLRSSRTHGNGGEKEVAGGPMAAARPMDEPVHAPLPEDITPDAALPDDEPEEYDDDRAEAAMRSEVDRQLDAEEQETAL